MKRKVMIKCIKGILMLIFLFEFTIGLFAQQTPTEFPTLTGPYLGQKPPGMMPELFAPGIVSKGANDMSICFSPDGDEVFYFITGPSFKPRIILSSHLENNVWTKPNELPFFDKSRTDSRPFMTPDGRRLFFNSGRPYQGMDDSIGNRDNEIWFVKKNNKSWGEPQKVIFGGQNSGAGTFPSVASSGNIYFSAMTEAGVPNIFYSKFENGQYNLPERLSDEVNGGAIDRNFHPYIAPDESYLLFDSMRDGETFGAQDIYVSFRNKEGKWSNAQNIGGVVNSSKMELRPYVTFDGKYLFFISNRIIDPKLSVVEMTDDEIGNLINSPGNGLQDIYWVSAKIIEELKPKELK